MSLTIEKKGKKYFVENPVTKKVLGHFDTKRQAEKHIKNVETENAPIMKEFNDSFKIHMRLEDEF